MGWAENRIRDYRHGAPASWLERRMLEHANPVHFPIAVAASLGLACGLWSRRRSWIVGASALALAGHIYCWTRPDGQHEHDPGPADENPSTTHADLAVAPVSGQSPSMEGAEVP